MVDRHDKFMRLWQYPTTVKLDREVLAKCTYSCKDGICAFDVVKGCIMRHMHKLQPYCKVKDMIEIVEDIELHPHDSLPHMLDGFRISRLGLDLVSLQRVDDAGVPHTSGRTAMMQYQPQP